MSYPTKRVPVKLGDGTKKRFLRYDPRALVWMEEQSGQAPATLFQRMGMSSLKALAVLVCAGLIHDEPDLTAEDTADLIPLDRMDEIAATVTLAYVRAVGKESDLTPEMRAILRKMGLVSSETKAPEGEARGAPEPEPLAEAVSKPEAASA